MPTDAMWRLRRAFWNGLALFKFRGNTPARIGPPRPGRRLGWVPLDWKYPGIAVREILVADRVPGDESFLPKRLFARLQAALYGIFGPMQPGLPPVAEDPVRALDGAYTAAHRRQFPAPVRPREYQGEPDLGALAVASPYACYLEAYRNGSGGGRFRWDFRALDGFDRHPGLRPVGAVVEFTAADGGLTATRIDSDAGSSRPGDADWPLAQRLALCAATTHLSLVRHFNGVHLACGSPMALATRNELPVAHPLRRLLWPHVFGTQYSNEMVTMDQMMRGGDFESIFSFTHGGTCALFEATHDDFDLASVHPALDAARRGIAGAGFATPALDNRTALYDAIERHCRRYLAIYYSSDAALAADPPYGAWLNALDRAIPNGVRSVAGPGVTLDGAARLLATLIYLATVEHEIVGSGVWDYQLWTDVQPVRVARSGKREPLDVYQRLVNANFNLNVHRTPLLTDFSPLALDPAGADAFRRFQADLIALQADLDRQPPAPWRMEPQRLKANINA